MKIDFEITQHGYTYRDALFFPDDAVPSDDEIEIMKQARFDAWYDVILNPPAVPNDETEVI